MAILHFIGSGSKPITSEGKEAAAAAATVHATGGAEEAWVSFDLSLYVCIRLQPQQDFTKHPTSLSHLCPFKDISANAKCLLPLVSLSVCLCAPIKNKQVPRMS